VNKLKKIRILLVASLMIMSFSACMDDNSETTAENEIITETVPVKEITTEAETEAEVESEEEYVEETDSETETEADSGELEVTYTGATKEIGEEKFGYMQVPEDWLRFYELGVDEAASTMYQYSSPDQVSVVTMSYSEDLDAETLANAYYQGYSQDAVDGLTAATVTLDGKTAYQIYGYFTDVNKIMVTWVFDGEDGLAHSLSIESQDYDIISLSGTYTLNK